MSVIIWLALAGLFLIAEGLTFNLVSIWFAVGAALAAAAAALGAGTLISVFVFAVTSAVTLFVFKKFIAKKLTVKHQPTNADRLIGKEALVTESIEPLLNKGAVEAGGLTWSASADSVIEKGKVVEITDIKGVKLIVRERVKV